MKQTIILTEIERFWGLKYFVDERPTTLLIIDCLWIYKSTPVHVRAVWVVNVTWDVVYEEGDDLVVPLKNLKYGFLSLSNLVEAWIMK
jgi:hypothetical protein